MFFLSKPLLLQGIKDMVSALVTKGISLQLTPMQLSEFTPKLGGELVGTDEAAEKRSGIVVHPGELCRVTLEIKNWESESQLLTLKMNGTFPLEWCQVQTDDSGHSERDIAGTVPAQSSEELTRAAINLATVEVPAKKSWHGDIWFLVPKQFFEAQDNFTGNSVNRFNQDFLGCVSVYANQPSGRGLEKSPIQQSDFELNIRPHSAYTAFLPTVYQEVDFIHRFIKIFEQAFDPVVNSFTSMWATLDPLTAPESLIPFLAHWVDWPLDSQLDLPHQRRLIRRAVEIYKSRGTRKGLRFYLHLYTGLPLDEQIEHEEDKAIAIAEPFGQGCLFGIAYVGRDAIFGGGRPYHFEVRLRTKPDNPIDEQLVRRIIDQEKPAFCSYDLCIETIISPYDDPPCPP
jgi:phage tail-like protein